MNETISKYNFRIVKDNRVAICLFEMGYPILKIQQNKERKYNTDFIFKETHELKRDYEKINNDRDIYFKKFLDMEEN